MYPLIYLLSFAGKNASNELCKLHLQKRQMRELGMDFNDEFIKEVGQLAKQVESDKKSDRGQRGPLHLNSKSSLFAGGGGGGGGCRGSQNQYTRGGYAGGRGGGRGGCKDRDSGKPKAKDSEE
eukprot:798304-Rhodomonas_salina.1